MIDSLSHEEREFADKLFLQLVASYGQMVRLDVMKGLMKQAVAMAKARSIMYHEGE